MLRKTQLLIALSMAPLAVFAEQTEWVVLEDQANCILEHLSDYRQISAPVVVIAVEECPNTNPFAGSIAGKSNFGGIGKIKSQRDASGFDRHITYSAEELKCLTANKVTFKKGKAFFPKRVSCGE